MAQPITNVNIVLNNSTTTRAGFGIPLFLAAHNSFSDRVRTYKSLSAVEDDFPTTSLVWNAARAVFSANPRVESFKVGRVDSNPTITPLSSIVTGVDVGFSFNIIDTATGTTSPYSFSYTVQAGDDVELVVDVLVADITAASILELDSVTKVGTGDDASVVIDAATGFDIVVLPTISNAVLTNTAVSVAPTAYLDAYNLVADIDSDFFFVAADTREGAQLTELANKISAEYRLLYTSTSDTDYLSPTSTTWLDTLLDSSVKNLRVFYHQDDTKFAELIALAEVAPFSPDVSAVVHSNMLVDGIAPSENADGNNLTATNQLVLDSKNTAYIVRTGLGNAVMGGKLLNGDWVDDIRNLYAMTARIKEEKDTLLLNQKGRKIQGNLDGVAKLESCLLKALLPFVASNAIQPNIDINSDDAVLDDNTRCFEGMTFTAELTQGIVCVRIDGELTNNTEI